VACCRFRRHRVRYKRRFYVATRPVDFRKGIDGLALAVQEMFGHGSMTD
jgi:hypothetical protein